jgi:hypothetical protein
MKKKLNPCYVCQKNTKVVFQAKVLKKYLTNYLYCSSCGFLRVDNPHWLHEAYASSISITDTGIIMRNNQIALKLCSALFFLKRPISKRNFLDIAGGYGLLTRMMRDLGFNFFWSDKYTKNLFAQGFESKKTSYDSITAIEVFEHIQDPVSFVNLELSLRKSPMLFFTTELFKGDPPNPKKWWYYSLESGQHISFYQLRTLRKIACKLDIFFYSANGIHLFSKKKINFLLFYISTNVIFVKLFINIFRLFHSSKIISDHNKLKK